MKRMCRDCGYLAASTQQGICPLLKMNVENGTGCPAFTERIAQCELCGGALVGDYVLIEDSGKWRIAHEQCLSSGCGACVQVNYCPFQTDSSCPEPQMIMIEKRQGNMIMQTQQINPKRIEATCAKDCPCYNKDGVDDGYFCMKQINCKCCSHKYNWRD